MTIRRIIALLAMLAMLAAPGARGEAVWPDGLGPAKPYPELAELNLDETIGYFMPSPRANAPAVRFCDRLEICLPRTDVATGSGSAHLYAINDGQAEEIDTIDFTDASAVRVKKLDDEALSGLRWGSGVVVTLQLNRSLKLGRKYYVLMDEGCLTAGGTTSPALNDPALWTPALEGEFGVSNLRFIETGSANSDTGERVKRTPAEGDTVLLDIALGGHARTAVVFSENDSVRFEVPEYKVSATAVGLVRMGNVRIGVLFLDELGQTVDTVTIAR